MLTSANPTRETLEIPGWGRTELLVAVVAAVVSLNVLPNDYCLDDVLIVRDSVKVNDPGQWGAVWTTDHWSATRGSNPNRDLLYRPISLSSYRLVRTIFGPSAFPQHAVNLLLYAFSCALIVRFCRRLGGGESACRLAGYGFAVLPIHTEVVASVVGRSDLLATLGVLLALLAHRRSLTAVGSRRAWWRAMAALAAFAAMGAKESAICVVPILLLFDAYWCRAARASSARSTWWDWRTVLRLAYVLVPVVAYSVLRTQALEGRLYQQPPLTKTVNVLVDAPAEQQVLGVVQLVGMYIAKTVWPAVLSIKYSANGVVLARSVLDPHVLLGLGVIVAFAAGAIVAWRRGDRRAALLATTLAVSYLPTANALVLMQVFFAERIWFLPSAWLALLLGWWLGPYVCDRRLWIPLGVIGFSLTARGWIRCGEWRDNGTLYAAAYRDQPDAMGPLHLYGQWLVAQGDLERGASLLRRAVEMDLGFTDAHRALGHAHRSRGDLNAARWHLQMANMQVPDHLPTVEALAHVSSVLSARDDDLTRLERVAAADPDSEEAQIAVIRKLRDLGRVRDARIRSQQVDDDFQWSARWHAEYAVTLTLLDRVDEAIDRYRRSLSLDADRVQTTIELAMLLRERITGGDLEEAWRLTLRAEELEPDAPLVLVCKAELVYLRGDRAEALRLYSKAIDGLPPGSAQRRIFEQRARTMGR